MVKEYKISINNLNLENNVYERTKSLPSKKNNFNEENVTPSNLLNKIVFEVPSSLMEAENLYVVPEMLEAMFIKYSSISK